MIVTLSDPLHKPNPVDAYKTQYMIIIICILRSILLVVTSTVTFVASMSSSRPLELAKYMAIGVAVDER